MLYATGTASAIYMYMMCIWLKYLYGFYKSIMFNIFSVAALVQIVLENVLLKIIFGLWHTTFSLIEKINKYKLTVPGNKGGYIEA